METKDYNKIVSAEPLYPNIIGEGAEQEVINLFNTIKEKENKLAELRMEANLLDQELKPLIKAFYSISKLFNITYGTKETKEIKNSCLLGIINKEDYRNK